MSADELKPEFIALPLAPNGLPDLLIITKSFVPSHSHGIVHAYIVPSAQDSNGYWAEVYKANGELAIKWATLLAMERVRQHVVSLRSSEPGWVPKPINFPPFDDWDALAVQRELGFYPMLQMVANASTPVFKALQDTPAAYEVKVTPMHYNSK